MRPRLLVLLLMPLMIHAAAAQDAMVAGRVHTRDGKPAKNAALLLRWRMAPELPGLCGYSLGERGIAELPAAADERGAFKVALPHRGPFELIAMADGDRSTPQFPVMAGAFVELHLAAPVTLGGLVVDADNAPVADKAVSLVPEFSAWSKLAAYRLPEMRARAVTDAEGRFELPFHDAYLRQPRWEPFLVVDIDVDGLAAKKLELLRPTEHCRELVLQLVPSAKAHPRSPRAAPRGSKPQATSPRPTLRARLQTDGVALASAPVLWSRLSTDEPPTETQATTDADGLTVLPKMPPDVTVLGFVQQRGHWLPCARLRVQGDDMDLGTVNVIARAVKGQALDASGQPIAGARVAALAEEPLDDELPYVTYTDHGGRFAFDALPPGALALWAECGRHGFAAAPAAAGTREVTLRTPAEGVVHGETLDAEGKPFAGAWLVMARQGTDARLMPGLRQGSTHLCVHSDAEGQVQVSGLPPGNWQVIGNAIRNGHLYGGSAMVSPGGAFALTLQLMRE